MRRVSGIDVIMLFITAIVTFMIGLLYFLLMGKFNVSINLSIFLLEVIIYFVVMGNVYLRFIKKYSVDYLLFSIYFALIATPIIIGFIIILTDAVTLPSFVLPYIIVLSILFIVMPKIFEYIVVSLAKNGLINKKYLDE
jgi:hypothetical protein